MATDDSYEIMPYKEIVELKKQIAELQKKTGDTSSQELLGSMASLTKSMNSMLQLFSSAAEEMKLEEKTESELTHKIAPLIDKVNHLEVQNKTIAEGLVAIADMIKEMKVEKKHKEIKSGKPLRPSNFEPPEEAGFPPLEPPEEAGFPPLEPPEKAGFPPLAPPKPTKMPPSHTSPRVVLNRPPPGMPSLGGPMPLPGAPPGLPPLGGPMPPSGPGFGELPPLPPLEEEHKKKSMFKFFKKK